MGCTSVLSRLLEPGVIVIAAAALSVSVFSVYFSRVLLPLKMKRAYLKSITTLAAVVETKDSGTVGHAQRVAELTTAVARRMGIFGKELERMQYAALLRDIGKANIPQAILNKTEPLTDAEWVTVQAHTLLGAEMVAAVPFLADTADYVRHHHECWDGSGYPDKMECEQIPLGSRILSVASDYDAMISERPYHPVGASPEEAVREIESAAGVKYDPVVVEAFVDLTREGLLEKLKAA